MNKREKQAMLLGVVAKGEREVRIDYIDWEASIKRVCGPHERLVVTPTEEAQLVYDDYHPQKVITAIVNRY